MRVAAWVAAVVLATAAGAGPAPAAGRFAYDRALPLSVRVTATVPHRFTVAQAISFVVDRSTRISAWLVMPRARGRHPAVLLVPGRRRPRGWFLQEARRLAARGAVALSLSDLDRGYPTFTSADVGRLELRVVALRRALDLLAAQPDVDPTRLAYVGHSDGGELGAMLAGVDHRVRSYVLMSVGGIWDRSPNTAYDAEIAPLDADNFVRHARPAALFIQSGTEDTIIPGAEMRRFQALASNPKRTRWYHAPHDLDRRAQLDRDAWLVERLGLGR